MNWNNFLSARVQVVKGGSIELKVPEALHENPCKRPLFLMFWPGEKHVK